MAKFSQHRRSWQQVAYLNVLSLIWSKPYDLNNFMQNNVASSQPLNSSKELFSFHRIWVRPSVLKISLCQLTIFFTPYLTLNFNENSTLMMKLILEVYELMIPHLLVVIRDVTILLFSIEQLLLISLPTLSDIPFKYFGREPGG